MQKLIIGICVVVSLYAASCASSGKVKQAQEVDPLKTFWEAVEVVDKNREAYVKFAKVLLYAATDSDVGSDEAIEAVSDKPDYTPRYTGIKE